MSLSYKILGEIDIPGKPGAYMDLILGPFVQINLSEDHYDNFMIVKNNLSWLYKRSESYYENEYMETYNMLIYVLKSINLNEKIQYCS